MPRRAPTLLVALLALAAAGCGGGGGPKVADAPQSTQTTQTSTAASDDAPAGSAAAALRSRLVALQVEESFQTAIAAATGVVNGFDSPGFDAAARTARSTSRTLADTYAQVADAPLKSPYRAVWRRSTQALLHAAAGQKGAAADLRRAEQARENMVLTVSPRLDGRRVAADRHAQLAALRATITELRERTPSPYAGFAGLLRAVDSASALEASAGAAAHPDAYAGSATSSVATLRAVLTSALVSHVHLAALALDAQRRAGPRSPATQTATSQLRGVDGLLDTWIKARGKPRWQTFVDGLDTYARQVAGRQADAAQTTLDDLDADGKRLGATFGSKGMFGPWMDSYAALVRAEVAGSPRIFDRIADTARKMPGLAELVADHVAQEDPARYPPR